MTVRQTSKDAFHSLTNKRKDTWYNIITDLIADHPPYAEDNWTRREIRKGLIELEIMSAEFCLSSTVSARVRELIKKKILVEVGTRRCTVSGRIVGVVQLDNQNYRDIQNEQICEEAQSWFKENHMDIPGAV